MNNHQVIYEFSEQQIMQLQQLYQQVWWGKTRTLAETEQCLSGSQLTIGILDKNDNLIGFTRVLSDFIYKAIIFDVIVCETQQGTGLGKVLIQQVKQNPKLQAVQHFELYCLPEMSEFYQRYGFSDDVGGVKLMRCSQSK